MQREFVSYPKSGRSWVRFILLRLGVEARSVQKRGTPTRGPQAGASVTFHHDGFGFIDGRRPPHDFDVGARLRYYRSIDRLVYMQRDPRDVMVSLFHQVTGRVRHRFGFEGSLSDFIRDDYFGAQNLARFRNMWEQIQAETGCFTLSYEQCHKDMEAAVRALVDYLRFDASAERIAAAVEKGRFESMKQIEQAGNFPEGWLRPNNGAPKVREGKIGGFREVLSEPDITYLNDAFGIGRP